MLEIKPRDLSMLHDCFSTELQAQYSDKNVNFNLVITHSCLNIVNYSTKGMKHIKIFNLQLDLRCTNPNAEMK
jgi:hypothetical protein